MLLLPLLLRLLSEYLSTCYCHCAMHPRSLFLVVIAGDAINYAWPETERYTAIVQCGQCGVWAHAFVGVLLSTHYLFLCFP